MKTVNAPFRFKGGVHPPPRKEATAAAPCRVLPVPAELRVPLMQHLGAPARPLVAVGDAVLRGQRIGEPGGFVSAAVHAPTSGVVKAIEDAPTPTGRMAPHVVIAADGNDAFGPCLPPLADWGSLDSKTLVARIADAGVVGMGGAGFPTHVKLSPPPGKPIDTLILNGAECEPFLTSDHRAMLEHPGEIWQALKILRHVLGAKTVRVAIEANKPDAIEAMAKAAVDAEGDVEVVVLPTMYPQGSEKQQIYAVTGRQVPPSGLPMDVGCVVENAGTALAIYNAVVRGIPLDERIVTVTGPAVAKPLNVLSRVGVPYSTLIAEAGGLLADVDKVISGGPMMGFAQYALDVSVSKTTSGILALRERDGRHYKSGACISCGRCNAVCPMRLLPSEMGRFIEADDIASAESIHLMDCFECGSCAFVCPARRPLVQHFRRAKAAVMLRRRNEKEKGK